MTMNNLVDRIIAYENGEIDDDGIVELFQYLIDTGLAAQLQGRIGRTAQDLIVAGHCCPPLPTRNRGT